MDGRSGEEHTYRYGKATDESEVNTAFPWENVRADIICEEDSLFRVAWLVGAVKVIQDEDRACSEDSDFG